MKPSTITARKRLVICGLVGLTAAIVTSLLAAKRLAPLIGWDVAALSYISSVLASVLHFDATATKNHAVSENPGRVAGDFILTAGSIASLAAVVLLIVQSTNAIGNAKFVSVGLGLLSVIISWILVHTSFMLRYARVYYGKPEGGISFNQDMPPTYGDFAYLAFTVGMAYQVSDTDIQSSAMRQAILRHAILSYVFGTVIIATTINTVASLS